MTTRLEAKAVARRARISAQQERPKNQMQRRPDMPREDVPRWRIGKVRIKTQNRQEMDERGHTVRTPPRRTPR
jgi:hypothetical protein